MNHYQKCIKCDKIQSIEFVETCILEDSQFVPIVSPTGLIYQKHESICYTNSIFHP